MTANDTLGDFERNARAVLEHSVSRIDGRTRSRLNQARQAALAAVGAPRRAWWRSFALMPAAGAVAAAVLVSVLLWHRQPAGSEGPVPDGQHVTAEDMELLADKDGLELMEGGGGDGFYEWAAAQTDNGESQG
jgi:hypothetical protein